MDPITVMTVQPENAARSIKANRVYFAFEMQEEEGSDRYMLRVKEMPFWKAIHCHRSGIYPPFLGKLRCRGWHYLNREYLKPLMAVIVQGYLAAVNNKQVDDEGYNQIALAIVQGYYERGALKPLDLYITRVVEGFVDKYGADDEYAFSLWRNLHYQNQKCQSIAAATPPPHTLPLEERTEKPGSASTLPPERSVGARGKRRSSTLVTRLTRP